MCVEPKMGVLRDGFTLFIGKSGKLHQEIILTLFTTRRDTYVMESVE